MIVLFEKFKGWLVTAAVAVAVIVAGYLKARADGRAAARAEQEQKRMRAIRDKRKSDDEIEAMPDADRRRELDRWMRD